MSSPPVAAIAQIEPAVRLDTRIAGEFTITDWIARRDALLATPSERLWRCSFHQFFRGRIASRYLAPIATLLRHDGNSGEGFSMVSLQCALIEFFAATVEGKSYRQRRKGEPPLGDYEYSNSRDLVVRFLHTEPPLDSAFTPDSAEAFYTNVRCGLLHEARTKNGWTIEAHSTGLVVDADRKIVYRNNLGARLRRFIARYGEELPSNRDRQAAFIRKFNSLCDL